MDSYWHKQSPDNPLYPDILWSRPETKVGAGKLAIIGGNAHAFGAPGIAWNTANESGIGVVKVLLPDAIKKTVRHVLPDAEFAPSNPSGSFSKKAMSDLLSIASWSDAALLAGDLGRNSETAVLLEEFVQKFHGLLTVTQDAADYFKSLPRLLLERDDTFIAVSLAQLQKFFINLPIITPITYSMTEVQLAEALHTLTQDHRIKAVVAVKHNDTLFIAFNGAIVSTSLEAQIWRIKTASRGTVFWLQNPTKPLESIVSSLI